VFVAIVAGLSATAGPIHTPCFVSLDQFVKRLLWCQAFVKVDPDGRAAEGERCADVFLSAYDADRQIYSLCVGVRGIF